MSSIQGFVALDIDRPTLGRHALIAGTLALACVLWIGAIDDIDVPSVTSEYVPVTTAGDVDVPGYYFPVEADSTEKYVAVRETDCGGTGGTSAHDFPSGWMKP